MKRFVIAIEETVTQEYEVFADNTEEAIEKSIEKYEKGEFVLEPGELQMKRIALVEPQNHEPEWNEF